MRAVDTNLLVRLTARDHPAQVEAAVEMLLNHAQLSIQDAEVVSSALEHFLKRHAFGFPDCLVLEIARKAGHLPLGTFDRALSKLEGARCV
jgi:predicted nucleic-acid-binding protein